MNKLQRAVAVLAILVSVAACAKKSPTEPTPTPPPPSLFLITADDGFFSPSQLTVSHGDTVTWFNSDLNFNPHKVASGACGPCVTDGVWSSDSLTFGETFTLVFGAGTDPTGVITFIDTTGTFPYFCTLHGVTGSITVNP